MSQIDPHKERVVAAALVALLALVLFLPTARFPFILTYDDPVYVTQNPHVLAGLTWDGVAWAFTGNNETSNWHPVTFLSHMLDVTLFGVRPGPHHVINVLLHAANAVLVLMLFAVTTGRTWFAALAAALFAAHPLRVESVAWIAERKDVLSTFFALSAMLAYVGYARRADAGRRAMGWYGAVVLLLALALMSKPTAVAVPFLLLVLDVWPLARARRGWALVVEKLPLVVLATLGAVSTLLAQKESMELLAPIALSGRVGNATVSAAAYLEKTVWPCGLAVFYPYPEGGHGPAAVTIAIAVLLGITALAAWQRRARPYIAVGWAWYLVALLPASGLVQAGAQSMADRYTYLPLTGIFVAAAFGAAALATRRQSLRTPLAVVSGALVAALCVASWQQLAHWRSSEALFRHAIDVTQGNYIAHNNLGAALVAEGRIDEAAVHQREAIRLARDYAEVWRFHAALAASLEELGRFDEAVAHYREVLRLNPEHPQAWNDIGIALARGGDLDASIAHYGEALRVHPTDPRLWMNRGIALERRGRLPQALSDLQQAVQLAPEDPEFATELSRVQGRIGPH